MSIVYLRNCTVLFAVRAKCYAEVASSSRVNLSSGISEASIFIYSPFPWNSMLTFFITGSCVLYFTAFLLHTVSREQPINIFFLSSLFIMCANPLFTGYCSNLSLKTEFWATIMGIFSSIQCYRNQRFNKQWFNVFLQKCFLRSLWGNQGMKNPVSKVPTNFACLFKMCKIYILEYLSFVNS